MHCHSGHDYETLRKRWEIVGERDGLSLKVLCEAGGYPVIVMENARAAAGEPGGLYISAGVHGDECAPVWALLQWAESDPSIFRTAPIVIFPCLNPHGLVENTRRDHRGIDLNRCFENTGDPLIGAWQTFLKGRHFEVALNLHEDFDVGGIYLYELVQGASPGDTLLAACEGLIPREMASMVDGSDFHNGLLSHSGDLQQLVEEELGGGYPEAIFLFLNYAGNAFTFETPSELDLLLRIQTQEAFIRAVARWAGA